jgi:hypothetical protein
MASRQSYLNASKAKSKRLRNLWLDRFLMLLFWGAILLVYVLAFWIAFLGAIQPPR